MKRLIIIVILLILLIVWSFRVLSLFNFRNPNGIPNIDFFAYYNAGKTFAMGLDPYKDNSNIDPGLSDIRIGGFSRYLYPPTPIPFFELLSRISYDTARLIWFILGLILFSLSSIYFSTLLPTNKKFIFFAILLVITFFSEPLLFHIKQGQIELINLALLSMAFLLYIKNHSTLSALCFVLAIAIKVYPLVSLVCLTLYYRDFKFLSKAIVWGLVILVLSFLLIPPALYTEYFLLILPSIERIGHYFNQSFLRFFSGYDRAWIISIAGFSLAALISWSMGSKTEKKNSPLVQASAFLVSILITLLFTNISWTMAYVIPIPFLAFIATLLLEKNRKVFFSFLIFIGLLIGPVSSTIPTNMIGAVVSSVFLFLLVTFWKESYSVQE